MDYLWLFWKVLIIHQILQQQKNKFDFFLFAFISISTVFILLSRKIFEDPIHSVPNS